MKRLTICVLALILMFLLFACANDSLNMDDYKMVNVIKSGTSEVSSTPKPADNPVEIVEVSPPVVVQDDTFNGNDASEKITLDDFVNISSPFITLVYSDFDSDGDYIFDSFTITDEKTAKYLNDFRNSNEIRRLRPDEVIDSLPERWVIYEDGFIIGLYRITGGYKSLNYGRTGTDIKQLDKEVELPVGMSVYIEALIQENKTNTSPNGLESLLNKSEAIYFTPEDIHDLVYAELVLEYNTVYWSSGIDDPSDLKWLEENFGTAIKMISLNDEEVIPECFFGPTLYMLRIDGTSGVIYPAFDDCRVFKNDIAFYDWGRESNRALYELFNATELLI